MSSSLLMQLRVQNLETGLRFTRWISGIGPITRRHLFCSGSNVQQTCYRISILPVLPYKTILRSRSTSILARLCRPGRTLQRPAPLPVANKRPVFGPSDPMVAPPPQRQHHHEHEGPYHDENVPLSLQFLVYLSNVWVP